MLFRPLAMDLSAINLPRWVAVELHQLPPLWLGEATDPGETAGTHGPLGLGPAPLHQARKAYCPRRGIGVRVGLAAAVMAREREKG